MKEVFVFKRRNRLKKHFVNTSNVLLYGYQSIPDAAKITFQVIDGFDWENKETGDSKGYVFPAAETLAKIRNTSVRTIQRHIKELEKADLLTRKRRRNKPSILIIEDVSEKEVDLYLKSYVDRPKEKKEGDTDPRKKSENVQDPQKSFQRPRNDKNVASKTPQTTKMSLAYKNKENEEVFKQKKTNVNDNYQIKKNGEGNSIREILKTYQMVKPKKRRKPEKYAKRDYFAEQMAEELNDQKSLGCYRVIAEKIPQSVVFEVLGSVRETARAGKIRRSRGALFVEIIKKYAENRGIDLGFVGNTGGG